MDEWMGEGKKNIYRYREVVEWGGGPKVAEIEAVGPLLHTVGWRVYLSFSASKRLGREGSL